MADTRRNISPGYGPGLPIFDFWQNFWASRNVQRNVVRSEKHLHRDQSGRSSVYSKSHRFNKHGRNTRYNLLRKAEAMSAKEHLQLA